MKINDTTIPVPYKKNLLEFLLQNHYHISKIAVELNGEIIPKTSYADVQLTDSDVVEVVCFVGGG
ncbi:sulfur carrier protein ThiS [Clostridium sp. WILCCON 0269]|uniref:Sulfur carrier protein ThiS n=1 Tax=Candidatus Clostridium eludens TaxID=3381663 RepID=A0ABW8SHA2_9CLOT